MPATDAQPIPLRGKAFEITFVIRSTVTGNPITGALTNLAVRVSKDRANFAAATNTPYVIKDAGAVDSGYGVITLSENEMDCRELLVEVKADNANAKSFAITVYPADMGAYTGRPIRFEQYVKAIFAYFYNKVVHNNAILQVHDDNPSQTVQVQGTITKDGSITTKPKLE